MDWSLRACARTGHVTYRPNETGLADALRAETPIGVAWKCLRCGAFIPGAPFEHGDAEHAPEVLHDRQIRDRVIIRTLAVERGGRGLLVWGLAWLVWQLRGSQESLEQLLAKTLPTLKPLSQQLGWNLQDSHILHLLHSAITTSQGTLFWVTFALVCYGTLQCVEAFGLWKQERWAEYLTVVATSLFVPIEIYEIASKVTFLRVGALVVNIGAVIWLLWTKHLFGFNGGAKAAHDEAVAGRAAIEYATQMHTAIPAP